MKTIVAVDKNWGIGIGNELLNPIPADMKFFREETSGEGKVVILGRKTLETFPGGRPLPKRLNVILTKNPDFKVVLGNEIYLCRDGLTAENFERGIDKYYHFLLFL